MDLRWKKEKRRGRENSLNFENLVNDLYKFRVHLIRKFKYSKFWRKHWPKYGF